MTDRWPELGEYRKRWDEYVDARLEAQATDRSQVATPDQQARADRAYIEAHQRFTEYADENKYMIAMQQSELIKSYEELDHDLRLTIEERDIAEDDLSRERDRAAIVRDEILTPDQRIELDERFRDELDKDDWDDPNRFS